MASDEKSGRSKAEERLDKLIELVENVARIDTKMTLFCEDTREELLELKKELRSSSAEHSKILARVETLEKQLIAAGNERIEWKAEFSQMKWRLGVIAPIVTVIVTTIVLWLLNQVWNIF